MPYVFESENISTPTSFAPGVGEEALRPAAVEDEVAVREVVHDRGARLVGEGDRLGEDALGRARPREGLDG